MFNTHDIKIAIFSTISLIINNVPTLSEIQMIITILVSAVTIIYIGLKAVEIYYKIGDIIRKRNEDESE